MQFQNGQSVGRYKIVSLIGQGGMADVYKAMDMPLDRPVAIKILRMEIFPHGSLDLILKRFEREARSLAALSHPNIVNVIEYGSYEGSPYLVLEYLPGGTLAERYQKPLPYQAAVRLLLPVAQALAYAHQEGIIHRDVKPSNILLTKRGDVKLADFGIARILEESGGQTLTGTGVTIGTPEYMSPEQGLGKPVDARADVYALGIVLYELVTGKKPFTADTPMEVVLKHCTQPLPSPRSFTPEVPYALEQVLMIALAKKADERYATMDAFAGALSRLLHSRQNEQAPGLAPTLLNSDTTIDKLFPITRDSQTPLRTTQPDKVSASHRASRHEPAVGGKSSYGSMTETVIKNGQHRGLSRTLMGLPVWAWIIPVLVLLLFGSLPALMRTPKSPTPAAILSTRTGTSTLTATPWLTVTLPPQMAAPTRTKTLTPTPTSWPTSTRETIVKIPSKTPTRIRTSTPSQPTFLAAENMNCRDGPGQEYYDRLPILKGEKVPVLARWSNNWLLIGIDRTETRSKCCWVGGRGELSVSINSLRLISVIPDRFTCTLE